VCQQENLKNEVENMNGEMQVIMTEMSNMLDDIVEDMKYYANAIIVYDDIYAMHEHLSYLKSEMVHSEAEERALTDKWDKAFEEKHGKLRIEEKAEYLDKLNDKLQRK
jgi:hypothetical protein